MPSTYKRSHRTDRVSQLKTFCLDNMAVSFIDRHRVRLCRSIDISFFEDLSRVISCKEEAYQPTIPTPPTNDPIDLSDYVIH